MNYFEVKKNVKKDICLLSDYSEQEENFLIEETLNLPKEKLLTKDFSAKEIKRINKVVFLRSKGKPLNKIFKKSYFYNNVFYINNNVLAPRQETEVLVETAINTINNIKKPDINVLDLCCGSGIIGLTIAKNAKNCSVTLSDVSLKALRVARKNTKLLELNKNVKFAKSNLFNNLKEENKFDIILSNPPYIKTSDIKKLDVGVKKYDPKLALDGGKDGLDFYRKISKNCKKFLTKDGCVIVEIGYNQKKDVETLFKENGFKTCCIKDFSKNDRVIMASLVKGK